MSDLWNTVSADLASEEETQQLIAARVATASLAPFLAAAQSRTEWEDRLALVAERMDRAVAAVVGDDPAGFAVLRAKLASEFEDDWQSVTAERQPDEYASWAREALASRHPFGEPAERQVTSKLPIKHQPEEPKKRDKTWIERLIEEEDEDDRPNGYDDLNEGRYGSSRKQATEETHSWMGHCWSIFWQGAYAEAFVWSVAANEDDLMEGRLLEEGVIEASYWDGLLQAAAKVKEALAEHDLFDDVDAELRWGPSKGIRHTESSRKQASGTTNYEDIDAQWNARYWSDLARANERYEKREKEIRALKGKEIEVIRGRKIPLYTRGTVFWVGESKYGGWRVGFKDASGQEYWTDYLNVQEVGGTTASKTAASERSYQGLQPNSWYVADRAGAISGGPYDDEASARRLFALGPEFARVFQTDGNGNGTVTGIDTKKNVWYSSKTAARDGFIIKDGEGNEIDFVPSSYNDPQREKVLRGLLMNMDPSYFVVDTRWEKEASKTAGTTDLLQWVKSQALAAGSASVSRVSGTDVNALCDLIGDEDNETVKWARTCARSAGSASVSRLSGTDLLKLVEMASGKTASKKAAELGPEWEAAFDFALDQGASENEAFRFAETLRPGEDLWAAWESFPHLEPVTPREAAKTAAPYLPAPKVEIGEDDGWAEDEKPKKKPEEDLSDDAWGKAAKQAGVMDWYEVVVLRRGEEVGIVEAASGNVDLMVERATTLLGDPEVVSVHIINQHEPRLNGVVWSNGEWLGDYAQGYRPSASRRRMAKVWPPEVRQQWNDAYQAALAEGQSHADAQASADAVIGDWAIDESQELSMAASRKEAQVDEYSVVTTNSDGGRDRKRFHSIPEAYSYAKDQMRRSDRVSVYDYNDDEIWRNGEPRGRTPKKRVDKIYPDPLDYPIDMPWWSSQVAASKQAAPDFDLAMNSLRGAIGGQSEVMEPLFARLESGRGEPGAAEYVWNLLEKANRTQGGGADRMQSAAAAATIRSYLIDSPPPWWSKVAASKSEFIDGFEAGRTAASLGLKSLAGRTFTSVSDEGFRHGVMAYHGRGEYRGVGQVTAEAAWRKLAESNPFDGTSKSNPFSVDRGKPTTPEGPGTPDEALDGPATPATPVVPTTTRPRGGEAIDMTAPPAQQLVVVPGMPPGMTAAKKIIDLNDPHIRAKVVQIARAVIETSPGMPWPEARRVAMKTVQTYPRMVR